MTTLIRNLHRNFAAASGEVAFTPKPLILCLERAIGDRANVDETLWNSGAFDAQVYPDLPFASDWAELLMKTVETVRSGKRISRSSPSSLPTAVFPSSLAAAAAAAAPSSSAQALTVRTIGAQCRSRDDLRARMQKACKQGVMVETKGGGGNADALLLLSGSHPARALPFADSLLASSFSMLRDAVEMRRKGDLPESVALWAVENPINPPTRLNLKVEAGAEVVLTQPPFLRSSAERWFDSAQRSGAAEQAKVLAGVPIITSIGNLQFWLRLCGVDGGGADAEAVLRSFPTLSSVGDAAARTEEYQCAVREWNIKFLQWVREKSIVHNIL